MEFHLIQDREENCHHDHIPFNLRGIGNIDFSVQAAQTGRTTAMGRAAEERLVSLGITGDKLRAPPLSIMGPIEAPPPLSASWGPSWEPPETLPTSGQYSTVEFKGDPHLGPHQTPFRWRNFCLSWAQTA